jgi:hypothetical protein
MIKGRKEKLISGGAGLGQSALPFSSDGVQANKEIASHSFWIRVEDELPEEGETVLVLTADYAFGYGYWDEKKWEFELLPWMCSHEETEVIYWAEIPGPPFP